MTTTEAKALEVEAALVTHSIARRWGHFSEDGVRVETRCGLVYREGSVVFVSPFYATCQECRGAWAKLWERDLG